MRTVRAEPRASVLIESLRDVGYSLDSALADIVDNSITAGATSIDIFAETSMSEPRIGILDNGSGMSESELMVAMRPGSRSPIEDRGPADLGRFGLGLKTASFSQCRRMTVVTRRAGVTSAGRWDLDHVAETDEWLVQIPDDPSEVPWSSRLEEQGTLVVWESMDRIAEQDSSPERTAHLVRILDDAREHLELVFHRFLSGDRGLRRIQICLNERPLQPFDPFRTSHPATITGPVEKIRVGRHIVTVQAFTLPHHQKVSPAEWERYAGRAGYVRTQGFYVYREKRLIIHGTWFGLARQTELTKLARVRIDMPNGLDSQWKIDVRKASAQPPRQVRERLRRIIEAIGATSRRVYTSRGQRLVSDNRLPVWIRVQDKNEITYQVNLDHPVLVSFRSRLSEEMAREFREITEITASTLPMDALFADLGSDPDSLAGSIISDESLDLAVRETWQVLTGQGVKADEITGMLQAAEPFHSNWARAQLVVSELTPGGTQHV